MTRSAEKSSKVAHVTTVHAAFDPRIFHKECVTLASAGYDVVLIAPHPRNEVIDGVRIRGIPRFRNRILRMIRGTMSAFSAAVDEDCALYHIHDPELIPVGWLLRLHGKHVVYDVHEDYFTAIRQKEFIPKPVRFAIAPIVRALEVASARAFHVVLAERYYQRRFPRGTPVLNYPLEEKLAAPRAVRSASNGPIRLLYTGVVTEDRGALLHARLVTLRDDIEVHVIGRCSADLYDRMREIAGSASGRLHVTGTGEHVPYERILDAYTCGGWTAGLALFPPTPHYREKELTKFFEYMAAGIPIICSDFPVWKALIEEAGCGITVDPADDRAARAAISWLHERPAEALEMGRRGREAVSRKYTWRAQGENLLAVYSRILAGLPENALTVLRDTSGPDEPCTPYARDDWSLGANPDRKLR